MNRPRDNGVSSPTRDETGRAETTIVVRLVVYLLGCRMTISLAAAASRWPGPRSLGRDTPGARDRPARVHALVASEGVRPSTKRRGRDVPVRNRLASLDIETRVESISR